jgi:hypothetical protein
VLPSPADGWKCGCSRERSLAGVREDRLAGPSGQAWSIRFGRDDIEVEGRVYSLALS